MKNMMDTTRQHDRMVPARGSEERESFVVEVWNRLCSDVCDSVGAYSELVDGCETGDFPGSVWPYRFAMIACAHRGDECAYVLRCYRKWDEMLQATVARMADDEPEYPRYALDMDTRECWHADMDIALRRAA